MNSETLHSNNTSKENPTDKTDIRCIYGSLIGKFAGFDNDGIVFVDFLENPSEHTLPARVTVSLEEKDIGRDVVLLFEKGNPLKPIVVGLIQAPEKTPIKIPKNTEVEEKDSVSVDVDGEQVTFTAEKEIILRCGKASITLTYAGKVLIKGEYLLNCSSGVNRIKGGSVQIN